MVDKRKKNRKKRDHGKARLVSALTEWIGVSMETRPLLDSDDSDEC